jgi:tRNA G37 N-methylase Trm5
MIDYVIKKLTREKTLKDGSINKHVWYEILFYVKTAKEQFLFDEVTKTHSEYQTPFINFLDYYKEDNGKDFSYYTKFIFPKDYEIVGVVSLSEFSDNKCFNQEDAVNIKNYIVKQINALNRELDEQAI